MSYINGLADISKDGIWYPPDETHKILENGTKHYLYGIDSYTKNGKQTKQSRYLNEYIDTPNSKLIIKLMEKYGHMIMDIDMISIFPILIKNDQGSLQSISGSTKNTYLLMRMVKDPIFDICSVKGTNGIHDGGSQQNNYIRRTQISDFYPLDEIELELKTMGNIISWKSSIKNQNEISYELTADEEIAKARGYYKD